jgi:hypothetical protein
MCRRLIASEIFEMTNSPNERFLNHVFGLRLVNRTGNVRFAKIGLRLSNRLLVDGRDFRRLF